MARRAQQSSVARCPYCEAFLPHVAVECPECRFPFTMAAADGGDRQPEHSGTSSTATRGTRPASSVVALGPAETSRAPVHGNRAHRIRIGAWMLGVTAILVLLAGVGALFTASSPGAASDREATANLFTALQRAKGILTYRQEVAIDMLGPDVASDAPRRVSVDEANGLWFAAAKSTSGSCWLLAAPLTDGAPFGSGTLGKNEPCTGAHIRLRYEERLAKG